jgi:hypothetical protein
MLNKGQTKVGLGGKPQKVDCRAACCQNAGMQDEDDFVHQKK